MASKSSPPERLRGRNDNHVAWLLRRIWDRLNRKNEHFMGVVVGQEGSGKSHTAIRIADEVDPTFNSDRIIFDVSELLKRLKDGEHDPGYFYVLDEAGVQLGRRTWQERSQVLANQALQLIRDHNLGLIFTLPRLGEFDSQAQGRLQAALELTEKDEDVGYVRGKWKFFDPDRMDETGTIYKKYPRRREDGKVKRITSLAFQPPREDLIRPYEERKSKFQEQFYEEVIEEMDDSEDDDDASKSAKEIAMEIADGKIGQFISEHGHTGEPYINKELIRAEYETTHNDAQAIKSILEQQYTTSQLEGHQ